MTDKTSNMFTDYVAGRMSRRELVTRAAKLGLGAAAAGMMLNQAMTQAMAASFDWQKYKGKGIKLLAQQASVYRRDADEHRELQEVDRARRHL